MLGSDAVPDLLGYGQGTQEADDIVTGGHITYVIWDKVPGDSLTQGAGIVAHGISFVTCSVMPTSKPLCSILLALPSTTNSLSRKPLHCGFEPSLIRPSKIIYDESSGNMYGDATQCYWGSTDKIIAVKSLAFAGHAPFLMIMRPGPTLSLSCTDWPIHARA